MQLLLDLVKHCGKFLVRTDQPSIIKILCRMRETNSPVVPAIPKIRIQRRNKTLNFTRVSALPLSTLFLAGKAFPESDPRVLEISYATVSDAGNNLGQSRLTEHPLMIRDIYNTLERIAETSGSRSRDRKLSLLQTILTQTSQVEAEYLI